MKEAETALKGYYQILDHRRESLKHHPDMVSVPTFSRSYLSVERMACKGGDKETFKLAFEADAVLSDPDRRMRYDMGEDKQWLLG